MPQEKIIPKTTFLGHHLPSEEWYDGRAEIILSGGVIVIAHPLYPPHVWSFEKKKFLEIRLA